MTRAAATEPRYLLVKGSSGLGNRMLCALTGILYARVSGRRLIVDWSDDVYSDDGSNVFFRLFACPSAGGIDELPDTASVAPRIWRGRLRASIKDTQRAYNRTTLRGACYRALERARLVRRAFISRRLQRALSIDVARAEYEERAAVLWSFSERVSRMGELFHGEFHELRRLSTFEILSMLLEHDLRPQPEIQARVEEFRKAHLDGPTVGVHLRSSDRVVRVDAALAELDSFQEQNPLATIFAATDNVEVKELLERRYPAIRMTPHWYPRAGAALHKAPGRPSRLENAIEALVDLYLLGGCDYLIGDSTSSFTRVAALLASSRGAELVDVGPARSELDPWRQRMSR